MLHPSVRLSGSRMEGNSTVGRKSIVREAVSWNSKYSKETSRRCFAKTQRALVHGPQVGTGAGVGGQRCVPSRRFHWESAGHIWGPGGSRHSTVATQCPAWDRSCDGESRHPTWREKAGPAWSPLKLRNIFLREQSWRLQLKHVKAPGTKQACRTWEDSAVLFLYWKHQNGPAVETTNTRVTTAPQGRHWTGKDQPCKTQNDFKSVVLEEKRQTMDKFGDFLMFE